MPRQTVYELTETETRLQCNSDPGKESCCKPVSGAHSSAEEWACSFSHVEGVKDLTESSSEMYTRPLFGWGQRSSYSYAFMANRRTSAPSITWNKSSHLQ